MSYFTSPPPPPPPYNYGIESPPVPVVWCEEKTCMGPPINLYDYGVQVQELELEDMDLHGFVAGIAETTSTDHQYQYHDHDHDQQYQYYYDQHLLLHDQSPNTNHSSEITGKQVGKYSVEERKDKIMKYLNKRNHRNFNKTIKYACRKTLAEKRVRVRGRFAKKNEEDEEKQLLQTQRKNNGVLQVQVQVQLKQEEDWLATLLYSPSPLPLWL